MRNTKIELGEAIKIKHLNNFMLKMKNSGYPKKYRTEILNSTLVAFDQILSDDSKGVKPLFRSRSWNREERNKEKGERKTKWYKSGLKGIEYTSVLFVPVTKGGILVKDLTKREEEINRNSDERIKFIEMGGIKVKDMLVRKKTFPITDCEMRKCVLCKTNLQNQLKVPCNINNVGYRLVCETCEERGILKVYEGETSCSARTRGAEHMRNFKNGGDDCAMFKHKQAYHGDENMKYRMEITKQFRDPLTRQANEAVRISQRSKYEILNSKNEFNHPPIARITVEGKRRKQNYKNVPAPAQPKLSTLQ